MKKYVIFAITSFVFIHHLVCSILYNAPVNPLSGKYEPHVYAYMNPLFMQKWLLFAPDPATSDIKLWYKVKSDQHWTNWQDPLQPILEKHQQWRFTYNAKLLYVYGNIAKDLAMKDGSLVREMACKSDSCMAKKNELLFRSPEFLLARRYVQEDYRKAYPASNADSIQLMVIQLYPKQFSERLSSKPFSYANSSEFPPVRFEKIN